MKTPFTRRRARGFPVNRADQLLSAPAGSRTILLISNDCELHDNLRSFANSIGLMLIRAEHSAGAVPILEVTRPIAVLLDLDLADEHAWETAELLLSEAACPAVLLLTGRTAQFDVAAAIRAGTLVSKSASPARIFDSIDQTLDMPPANQAERNAIQRVLIHQLRPSHFAESTTPAHRFWGINE